MSLFIYDDNVNNFIKIMKTELNLLSLKTCNWQVRDLPIFIVEDSKRHAYYDPNQKCIMLNKYLIYKAKLAIAKKILGHEVAHYLTNIKYGNVKHHGKEFQEICKEYNLFAPATSDLDQLNRTCSDEKCEILIEKIKKLFKLASSDNENEAKLATTKANQLLMKYNLSLNMVDSEKTYMTQVAIYKRISTKIQSIRQILKKFNVYTVNYTTSYNRSLQVSGSKANVEIAQYVYNYLDKEFDRLWLKAQKEHNLSGLRAKNSYFYGLARGFIKKMEESEVLYSKDEQNALVVIKQQTKVNAKQYIYHNDRIVLSCSNTIIDGYSSNKGITDGKKISIYQGVRGSKTGLSIE